MSREKIEARKAKKAKQKASKEESSFEKKPLWVLLALVLTLIAYSNVYDNNYLNYDDDVYVTENPPLRNLDIGTLYGEDYLSQYSPLAMTIQGLWFKVSDGNPKFIRGMSVFVHLVNVFLVFLVFRYLFKDDYWAALLALIFGVHPMQVESVAWLAAAMKIGSFTTFFLLGMWTYIRYLQTESSKFHLATYIAFLMACLCKEQAVVLPAVLISIDYLRGRSLLEAKTWLSKAPMFLISLIFGIITLKATDGGGELQQKVYEFGFAERLLFGMYSTGMYIFKGLLPLDLSFFYTYPIKGEIPAYYYAFPLIIGALIFLAIRAYKRDQRMLFFGILFFFITTFLTALTNVMSVRDVMMADRYIYLPILGVFFVIFTLLRTQKSAALKYLPIGLGLVYLVMAVPRVDVFQDTKTLFTDVIEKGQYEDKLNPYLALPYNNRGIEFKREGDFDRALADYEMAIKSNARHASAYLNRGNIRFQQGEYDQAIPDYNKTLELEPYNAKALSARGAIYASQKNYDAALADLSKAVEQDKYFVDAYSNRVLTYIDLEEYDKALADCNHILSVTPNRHDMVDLRGYVKNQLGDFNGAVQDYTRAIQLNPESASSYYNRAVAYQKLGDKASAKRDADAAKARGFSVPTSFYKGLR